MYFSGRHKVNISDQLPASNRQKLTQSSSHDLTILATFLILDSQNREIIFDFGYFGAVFVVNLKNNHKTDENNNFLPAFTPI